MPPISHGMTWWISQRLNGVSQVPKPQVRYIAAQGAALGAGGETVVAADVDRDAVDEQDRHDPPVAAQAPDRFGGQDRAGVGLTHRMLVEAIGDGGVVGQHENLGFQRSRGLVAARDQVAERLGGELASGRSRSGLSASSVASCLSTAVKIAAPNSGCRSPEMRCIPSRLHAE